MRWRPPIYQLEVLLLTIHKSNFMATRVIAHPPVKTRSGSDFDTHIWICFWGEGGARTTWRKLMPARSSNHPLKITPGLSLPSLKTIWLTTKFAASVWHSRYKPLDLASSEPAWVFGGLPHSKFALEGDEGKLCYCRNPCISAAKRSN